jgi:hypothetical protein
VTTFSNSWALLSFDSSCFKWNLLFLISTLCKLVLSYQALRIVKHSILLTGLVYLLFPLFSGVDIHVPKGYSKCGMCNYMSKFKANVTRHERSIHKINIEGSTLVTAQYMCALCEYRSMYRANLVRHEKSVHKVTYLFGLKGDTGKNCISSFWIFHSLLCKCPQNEYTSPFN